MVLAGVPLAAILSAVVFILAIAQVGPALVLIPAVIWVYTRYGAVWGTAFLVWAILCSTLRTPFSPRL